MDNLNVYSFLKEIPYGSLLPNEEFKSLSVKNLTLSFGHMQVFKDFNLEVLQKQKVLIQSESGCGKSTLAKIIVNLNNDDYLWEIFYNKNKYNSDTVTVNKISFLSEESTLFHDYKVQDIFEFSKLENLEKEKLLEMFQIDFWNENQEFKNLSLGQKQRLLVLKSYIENKDIKIYDESFANIDAKTRNKIIKSLLKSDKTMIIISHHMPKNLVSLFDQVINL